MFMKKSILLSLVIGSVGLAIILGGCQQTGNIPDVLQIESVSPALDATDVASTESLSVTFNFAIDNSGMTKNNLFSEYAEFVPGSHNAGSPEVTGLAWSNNNRTMTRLNAADSQLKWTHEPDEPKNPRWLYPSSSLAGQLSLDLFAASSSCQVWRWRNDPSTFASISVYRAKGTAKLRR